MGYGFSSNHGGYTLPVLHLHSMSGDAFTIPSPSRGLAHEPNPNSNPQQQQQQQQTKKKRNLAGTPDPDAEVLALSPRTLMATNRFVCEICNKGFQRDQNLQLHRRGHNLPWKLRQRDPGQEARKRVYVCPESSCVHHDPSRALGDLTGIKKHYSRKHGEKKWKCEKCSKRYAVYSDWKSHSKICGTREYKCDCGILFSRKDSFITHRAFCDAFAQESTRLSSSITADPSFQQDDATATLNGINFHANGNQMFEAINYTPEAPLLDVAATGQPTNNLSFWLDHYSHLNPSVGMQANGPNITADTSVGLSELLQISSTNAGLGLSSSVMNYVGERSLTPQMPIPGACLPLSTAPFVLMEANNVKGKDSVLVEGLASIYSNGNSHRQCSIPAGTHMSATGLLQRAALMGATVSDPSATSFLSGLLTSPESIHHNLQTNNEFQLFVQEKAMPESFQEMMMSSFPCCNILTDGDNNMGSRLMMENHVQTLGPPLQQPPSFLTRDFLGLGGDRSDQSILQQELAKLASMGSEVNMMSSSYSGIGGC